MESQDSTLAIRWIKKKRKLKSTIRWAWNICRTCSILFVSVAQYIRSYTPLTEGNPLFHIELTNYLLIFLNWSLILLTNSWFSWGLQSLVNGVYAFGFLFMLPQLFVNYKLKSVAHLPWRAFMYKVSHSCGEKAALSSLY